MAQSYRVKRKKQQKENVFWWVFVNKGSCVETRIVRQGLTVVDCGPLLKDTSLAMLIYTWVLSPNALSRHLFCSRVFRKTG